MTERKLRIALPTGHLADSAKWNIYNILKNAEIGYRDNDRKHITFESSDPEIEITIISPRDIPRDIHRGVYDLGVTGRDLAKEYSISLHTSFRAIGRDYLPLEEDLDLECGYVDLVFATSPEVLQKIEEIRKSLPPDDRNMSNLQIFTLHYPMEGRVRCRTEYPNIGSNFRRKFDIEESHGTTEEHILSGATNFILEAMATGRSLKQRNLVVLEKVMDSTARLYISPETKKDEWKQRKVQELKERIEAVVKDVREHCQVRIELDALISCAPKSDKVEKDLFKRYDAGEGESYFYLWGPKTPIKVDRIMRKEHLPKFREFIQQNLARGIPSKYAYTCSGFENRKYLGFVPIINVEFFELSSLYAYCPLMTDFYERDGYFKGEYVYLGNYPCADISKLRKEHREKAIIF
ncbi:ATP phosphoribosyltransferase [Candidatus Pacearchaeota archaeon]|nr:ATP phosphoribosyltransferase [Candidatus Pacearchaeota archaeon]